MTKPAPFPAWFGVSSVAAFTLLAFGIGYLGVEHWVEFRGRERTNRLEWIERTFHPNAEALAALKGLHRTYDPQLAVLAQELEGERQALAQLVLRHDRWSPEVARQIARVDEIAARNQILTWKYFYDVSQHLSPGAAQHFRREMALATLGLRTPLPPLRPNLDNHDAAGAP